MLDKKFEEIWKEESEKDSIGIVGLYRAAKQYAALDETERFAAYVYAVYDGQDIFEALMNAEYDCGVIMFICEDYLTDNAEAEFAEYLVDECCMWEDYLPKYNPREWFTPYNYLDWKKIGRDLRLCGDYDYFEDPDSSSIIWYSCHY